MNKILYQLSLGVAIFILISGIYFKTGGYLVSGLVFSKNGRISIGTIDANGTLILGVMILLFSIWMYRDYKTLKKESDKKRNLEEKEISFRKNNNGRWLSRKYKS